MSCYLDTSALAKWYLPEALSEEFEAFVRARDDVLISHLTICEMRSLLARRRRMGDLDAAHEALVWETFTQDRAGGAFGIIPVSGDGALAAADMIAKMPDIPLRTLDALHLAIATAAGARELASADKIMLRAASVIGLHTHDFSGA